MVLKPLVMINDTIKKYKIKEKHKILRGNLYGKKKPRVEAKASLSIWERLQSTMG